MQGEKVPAGETWRRRPVLGNLVRAVVVLGPLAFSVTIGLLVASLLPRPAAALWARVGWSIVVMAASSLSLLLAGRLARRLLPLSLLLRVGVVFPDTAPRRFGVALRAARPGKGGADHQDPASVLSLLAALLTHDRRTRGHSERVAAFALLIADELGLDKVAREEVRWAGLLHDVGKIDVPSDILNKPSGLDADEWAVMATHPMSGAARVAPLRPWLGDAVLAVDGHHERWDGSGYPRGVRAQDLPLSTRIVALADAVETMTAARSYKTPKSMQEARAEVTACAGGQFDPAVARAFLGVSVPRLWRVAGPLAWMAQVPLLGAVLQGSLAPGAVLAQGAVLTAGQVAGAVALVGTAMVATGPGSTEPVRAERAEAPASTEATEASEATEATDWGGPDAVAGHADRAEPPPDGGATGGGGAGAPRPSGATDPTSTAASDRPTSGGGPDGDPDAPTATRGPPTDTPGPVVPPPGQGGVPPGQGGVPPGNGGVPPGNGGVPPGNGGVPPGNGGVPPGPNEGNGNANRNGNAAP